MSLEAMIRQMAKDAKQASRVLRKTERNEKDKALEILAHKLVARTEEIMKGNEKDLSRARAAGLSS